jgi:hypothetical protein
MLAEVALAAGDGKLALESAQPAHNFFAASGMTELDWRSCLIAGLASQKLSDQTNAQLYLKSANDIYGSLAQKWGADTFKAYQERQDVQFYRRQLEQTASVR